MDSLPEYDVFPERDRDHIVTGRWCWEVFDAATQGPITGGVERSKRLASVAGSRVRETIEQTSYI